MISSTLKVGAGFVVGQVLYSGASAVVDYLIKLPQHAPQTSGYAVGTMIMVGCTLYGTHKLVKLAHSILGNNK